MNTYISARTQQGNEISTTKLMVFGSTYPMKLPEMLYDLTGSEKSKMAAFKTGKTSISACRHDRNEIPAAIGQQTMFSRSTNPMGLSVWLCDLTGSMKTKMTSFKPGIHISQLVNIIGTKLQRLYPCFRGQTTRLYYCGDCPTCELVVS